MTPKEIKEYRDAYHQYAQATRRAAELEFALRARNQGLMVKHDVSVGHGLDVWGDGSAKPKHECEKAPEVL